MGGSCQQAGIRLLSMHIGLNCLGEVVHFEDATDYFLPLVTKEFVFNHKSPEKGYYISWDAWTTQL